VAERVQAERRRDREARRRKVVFSFKRMENDEKLIFLLHWQSWFGLQEE